MEVRGEGKVVQLATKAVLDYVFAWALFLLLLPLFILLGVLIKMSSPGPVFFKQRRLGLEGRPFEIYKFRTMHHRAPDVRNADGSTYTGRDDPRIFALGRILRKFSLDELPQLLNVIRGDMSIVGPRPDLESQRALYEPGEDEKLTMKPGITGLAMIKGRNSISWRERIRIDIWYIQNYSLWLDLKIALLTLPVLAFGLGVSQDQKQGEKA
jgi:undecaprenyl phosphate N,N'-diacetylbacillosamine 1-phosphate transferase